MSATSKTSKKEKEIKSEYPEEITNMNKKTRKIVESSPKNDAKQVENAKVADKVKSEPKLEKPTAKKASTGNSLPSFYTMMQICLIFGPIIIACFLWVTNTEDVVVNIINVRSTYNDYEDYDYVAIKELSIQDYSLRNGIRKFGEYDIYEIISSLTYHVGSRRGYICMNDLMIQTNQTLRICALFIEGKEINETIVFANPVIYFIGNQGVVTKERAFICKSNRTSEKTRARSIELEYFDLIGNTYKTRPIDGIIALSIQIQDEVFNVKYQCKA